MQNFTFNLRFPGQVFDGQAGLHQNGFRDYDPAIGRYVRSDPIGLRGGINTYAYVEGNPVSNDDSLGLETGPAYHAIYTMDLPPQKGCDKGTCKGDDRIPVMLRDSACDDSDTQCFLAMQAAGLSHAPRTIYYSKSCLLKAGFLVKPAGFAGSELVRRGAPWLFGRLGFSESVVGAVSRGVSVGLGPEATVLFWLPFGLSTTASECECGR